MLGNNFVDIEGKGEEILNFLRGGEEKMDEFERIMDEFEGELSRIIGLGSLKTQLRCWAKQMLIDEKRRSLSIKVGQRRPPHMAFLGNPGTGKTTIARLIGKLLHMVGSIPSSKVVEVQRTDLVAKYIGQTGAQTRAKIKEAEGGILFVDEAYRLMPTNLQTGDFGKEALEEMMSHMDKGNIVVIFAGYREEMQHLISANPGFRRRVTKFFYFDDFTCRELANIAHLKICDNRSPLYGFRLHESCTVARIAEKLKQESSVEQRREMNGGLVDLMLVNARESLDGRLDVSCRDINTLLTITLEDLVAGLRSMKEHKHLMNKDLAAEIKQLPKNDSEEDLAMRKVLEDFAAELRSIKQQPKHDSEEDLEMRKMLEDLAAEAHMT
ncbi:AAA-type ATPase family protein / ankyrin repeat family protein [Striga hermonthica]|uniref:AAA-type ATPase family protein / ankyrin repeat family protein n=1 Tax=Striga hermonthica TaxID=68872 RepID=A0A9N7NHN0_STRHE|nr:AAA-type ATPase family protein / ankyrin repeat family protein [Striga hermonthica]